MPSRVGGWRICVDLLRRGGMPPVSWSRVQLSGVAGEFGGPASGVAGSFWLSWNVIGKSSLEIGDGEPFRWLMPEERENFLDVFMCLWLSSRFIDIASCSLGILSRVCVWSWHSACRPFFYEYGCTFPSSALSCETKLTKTIQMITFSCSLMSVGLR